MSTDQPADEPTTVVTTTASDTFGPWLESTGGSLLVSCYQAGKVALLSWTGQQVNVQLRDFPRPMGLAVDKDHIAIGTLEEIVVLRNAPELADQMFAEHTVRYDALYMPRVAYRTGEVAPHGLAVGKAGLWFVNTRFSCLAMPSTEYNFVPGWKPPFIAELVPEDHCHLNGMAMIDGEPRFVTCLGTTDKPGGWREDKVTGGVILSVPDGAIVARGLAMPHSPRWYDGRLWVLNSGHGQLAFVNSASGDLQVVATLPGYLRGLCFIGPYAVVGLSQIRERHIFGGLPVSEKFDKLLCGVAVVDVRSGATTAMFLFTAGCQEVFDVELLPGVRQGALLNNDYWGVRLAYTAPGATWWRRRRDEPGSEPDSP